MRSSTSFWSATLLIAALTTSAPIDLITPASPRLDDLIERRAATGCPNLIVIFARGTTEIGPLGELVGPALKTQITDMIGTSATFIMEGVPDAAYPADIPGFLVGGSPTGSKAMAKMAIKAVSACPSSKVVLSGYSQGGQVVHNACKQLPPAITSRLSVMIFGDPDNGDQLIGVNPGNVKIICHPDDNICQHGDTILVSHLTYGVNDSKVAAQFIVAGTPVGNLVVNVATPLSIAGNLYTASLDVSDTEISVESAQRAPAQTGPTLTASSFLGPQDTPSIFNLPNIPAALSPVKE